MPSPGLASSCVYNATASPTKGPATPDIATDCKVVTKPASSSSNIYNDGWLRFEVQLDPAYSCGTEAGTDCWWTLESNYGMTPFATDRMVYAVTVG